MKKLAALLLSLWLMQPAFAQWTPPPSGGGGGVTQIIAGTNVTISPSGGTGAVTINASGGGGGVSSVTNSDGSLTISPTTGAVVASLNVGNANTWTAAQTLNAITTFGSGIATKVRVVTASGAVTATSADYVVVVNKASGAATTFNLPGSPAAGETIVVKDGKGDAGTNNITVTPAAGTIDGASSYVMNVDFMSSTFVYNGTQWNIL